MPVLKCIIHPWSIGADRDKPYLQVGKAMAILGQTMSPPPGALERNELYQNTWVFGARHRAIPVRLSAST